MTTNAIIFHPNDEKKLLDAYKVAIKSLDKTGASYCAITPLILPFTKAQDLARLPLKDFKDKITAIEIFRLVITSEGAKFLVKVQTKSSLPLVLEIMAAVAIDKGGVIDYKEFPVVVVANVFQVARLSITNMDGCAGSVYSIEESCWVKKGNCK